MFNIPKGLQLVIFDLDGTLHPNRHFIYSLNVKQDNIIDFFYNEGITLAIASKNAFAEFALYDYGVIHKFAHIEQRKFDNEYILDEDILSHMKGTKLHMYKNILKRFPDIKPENILVIDDCFLHVFTAKCMGMNAIQVDPQKLVSWSDIKKGFSCFKERRRRASCVF